MLRHFSSDVHWLGTVILPESLSAPERECVDQSCASLNNPLLQGCQSADLRQFVA